jgi:putative ABC transport system ATP-binding protein
MTTSASPDKKPIIHLEGVTKEYRLGKVTVQALRGIDLTILEGEFLSVAGPSGSGKTTLLNMIGCIDTPTQGRVALAGQDTTRLKERQLTQLRLFKLGFIFQTFNLVGVLTAFQNVEFPLLLQRSVGRRDRSERVRALLERVGLADKIKHRPGELSGGQRQRVAIARALVTKPELVLADEPTANLDSKTGAEIVELMKQLNESSGTTFLLSTHDPAVMSKTNRIVRLVDGRLAE